MLNEEKLKYPIVLVHGIAAHDRGGIINYWGRIPEKLREKNANVYFGNTDAWGDYESNAKILKNTIDKILFETKKEKVNIIAHSKGGIDSRYFIWKYDFGDKVASLTTISTPHHGSEIADLIYKQKIIHTGISKRILDIFGKLYGDINPDLYNANYQLTTNKMKEFNENIGMDGAVYYQSIYTTMKNALDDLMFFYTYLHIKRSSGRNNDGLVSEYSAKWGNNIIKIEGGISHAEILDRKKRKISGVDIPTIFLNIMDKLYQKGF
jgi:triacylglycerol lipase